MELFVGNVPYGYSESDLRELFETCGDVTSIRMVMDTKTQKFKGFAFIAMRTEDGERKALAMHNREVSVDGPSAQPTPVEPSYGYGLGWGRRRRRAPATSRKLIVKPARANRRFRPRKKVAR